MTADYYINKRSDEKGNVKALLWILEKGEYNRVVDLKISAKLALKLYLERKGVYYLGAERYTRRQKLRIGGKICYTITADYYQHLIEIGEKENLAKHEGVIEIYANDMPNYRLERRALK